MRIDLAKRIYDFVNDRENVEALKEALKEHIDKSVRDKLRPLVREGDHLGAVQAEAAMSALEDVPKILSDAAKAYHIDTE